MILLCHNFAALLKEEEAECLCVPNVAGLLPEFFFRYLHLTVMFSGLLQKDMLKERLSLVESFFGA